MCEGKCCSSALLILVEMVVEVERVRSDHTVNDVTVVYAPRAVKYFSAEIMMVFRGLNQLFRLKAERKSLGSK